MGAPHLCGCVLRCSPKASFLYTYPDVGSRCCCLMFKSVSVGPLSSHAPFYRPWLLACLRVLPLGQDTVLHEHMLLWHEDPERPHGARRVGSHDWYYIRC